MVGHPSRWGEVMVVNSCVVVMVGSVGVMEVVVVGSWLVVMVTRVIMGRRVPGLRSSITSARHTGANSSRHRSVLVNGNEQCRSGTHSEKDRK